jgi:hypothetical protein
MHVQKAAILAQQEAKVRSNHHDGGGGGGGDSRFVKYKTILTEDGHDRTGTRI